MTQGHKTRIRTRAPVFDCCVLFFLPYHKCLSSMWWKVKLIYAEGCSSLNVVLSVSTNKSPFKIWTNANKIQKWKFNLICLSLKTVLSNTTIRNSLWLLMLKPFSRLRLNPAPFYYASFSRFCSLYYYDIVHCHQN